jgi:hypothetical protein
MSETLSHTRHEPLAEPAPRARSKTDVHRFFGDMANALRVLSMDAVERAKSASSTARSAIASSAAGEAGARPCSCLATLPTTRSA